MTTTTDDDHDEGQTMRVASSGPLVCFFFFTSVTCFLLTKYIVFRCEDARQRTVTMANEQRVAYIHYIVSLVYIYIYLVRLKKKKLVQTDLNRFPSS